MTWPKAGLPEWMRLEIMARYDAMARGDLQADPIPTEVERLAALGLDGSRLRRRYWKKVRFAGDER